MPTDEGLPDVGDVIMSPMFKFAKHSETGTFLRILNVPDQATPVPQLVLKGRNGEVHTQSAVSANIVGNAYDSSREDAKFVVEEARWFDNMITVAIENCSTRWYVTARRLKSNGAYDSKGERIMFFMCGMQDEFVLASKDIRYIRKMHTPRSRTAQV